MVVKHRRKSIKRLGYESHSGLRRRGSGNRGGVGKAGHGKRAKQKKSSFLVKGRFDYGKRGFITKREQVKEVTVGYLCEHADALCEKKDGKYSVSVLSLGYDKVLGSGVVNKPLVLKDCASITKKAADKIKKAGGDVITK